MLRNLILAAAAAVFTMAAVPSAEAGHYYGHYGPSVGIGIAPGVGIGISPGWVGPGYYYHPRYYHKYHHPSYGYCYRVYYRGRYVCQWRARPWW
jgi:hypothetical protein